MRPASCGFLYMRLFFRNVRVTLLSLDTERPSTVKRQTDSKSPLVACIGLNWLKIAQMLRNSRNFKVLSGSTLSMHNFKLWTMRGTLKA